MFLQLFVNGLVTGSVYAIAAVGISLIYGILRLVNFAYGDMMAFGAFAGSSRTQHSACPWSPRLSSRWRQWPSSRSPSILCSGARFAVDGPGS